MTVSPNFIIRPTWKGTLQTAFSFLRRVTLLEPSDFSFGDFDPQINWSGMTVTNVEVNRCRYLKINKFIWFSIDIRATLAAPLAAIVSVDIPTGATALGPQVQGAGALFLNGGTGEIGSWSTIADRGFVYAQRADFTNFSAGSWVFVANGFIEVK